VIVTGPAAAVPPPHQLHDRPSGKVVGSVPSVHASSCDDSGSHPVP